MSAQPKVPFQLDPPALFSQLFFTWPAQDPQASQQFAPAEDEAFGTAMMDAIEADDVAMLEVREEGGANTPTFTGLCRRRCRFPKPT